MRRFLVNVLVLLAAIAAGGALLEAGLRLFPSSWRAAHEADSQGGGVLGYRNAGGGLYTLLPALPARLRTACIDNAKIAIDAEGFRRKQPPATGGIFLLGDSYVEALQVADGETMADHLEALVGEPVTPLGISAYATLTEIEAYRRFIGPHKPKLVVLAFFLGNDITGNSCAFGDPHRICGRMSGGRVEIAKIKGGPLAPQSPGSFDEGARAPIETASSWNPKSWARRHFVLYQPLHDAKMIVLGLLASSKGEVRTGWGIYLDPAPADIEEAWAITEWALVELKAAVERDGAQLVILSIPEYLALSYDWKREVVLGGGSAVPDSFDPLRPSRRLADVAAKLSIPVVDLRPSLTAYRDRFSLPKPYFSFACDGHFNPLGHALAARAMAVWLGENGLAPKPDAKTDIAERPPQALLGEDAYRQIYHGGVYTGSSLLKAGQ